MNIFNFVFFVITFLLTANWFQISTLFTALISNSFEKSPLKDEWINKTVLKKTGLRLLDITLIKDRKMYGMMAGMPFWPKMILSEGLYKTLNKDELEWVILHEAGHCMLWHNLKAAVYQLVFISLGLYFIRFNDLNLLITTLLALLLSLICIQIIRWLIEYEADKYSIKRVTNPKGVITAQDKFRKSSVKNLFSNEKSLGRFFLIWNIYPEKRIEMANLRLTGKLD